MDNKKARKEEEKFFTDDNECVDCRREKDSPSGRFHLLVRYYKTKEGCWSYSRGTVYRKDTGEEVCDIKRNYSTFHHSFVEKSGQEWLITGRSYMSQTIVNLDTGEEFEPDEDHYDGFAFCWASCSISPDGNTLVVDGCHWACPYEFRFYDFTDPSKGWKQLEIGPDDLYIDADVKAPEWLNNETVVCHNSEEFYLPLNKFDSELTEEEMDSEGEAYENENNSIQISEIRTTLKRVGDKMVVVDKWISERKQQQIEEARIANEKYEAWRKDFMQNDPLYKTMKRLTKEFNLPADEWQGWGVCYKGWSETSDASERRVTQRFKGKHTIDLEWGIDKEQVKLNVFKSGKSTGTIWFEHSAKGMEDALTYIKENINGESIIKKALRALSQTWFD